MIPSEGGFDSSVPETGGGGGGMMAVMAVVRIQN